MANYYMNKNGSSIGDHRVHKEGCTWLPYPENMLCLGDFPSCHEAVKKAKEYDSDADGCIFCSNECHTR